MRGLFISKAIVLPAGTWEGFHVLAQRLDDRRHIEPVDLELLQPLRQVDEGVAFFDMPVSCERSVRP